jgi:hypothetical protein
MRGRLGFTLIELLIYLALLTGLSLLVFSFTARTYRFMIERERFASIFVRNVMAEDVIRRDLMVASPWPHDWDSENNTFKQLTMNAGDKPIELWVGYEINKLGLMRKEGNYNKNSHRWIKQSGALLTTYIKNIELKTISSQRLRNSGSMIIAVNVTVDVGVGCVNKERTLVIALRNKVV